MKIINSNDKKLFSGMVIVNGQEVYINVADGTGFKKIFELMKDVIYVLSRRRYTCSLYKNFEDVYQDVCVSVLEGIVKYQPDRCASLSTFLYLFVESRTKDFFKRASINFKELDDLSPGIFIDPINRIDVMRRAEKWDNHWKGIMFRLFVNEEDITSVARDIDMTPWGLTRAVRRKLQLVRNV